MTVQIQLGIGDIFIVIWSAGLMSLGAVLMWFAIAAGYVKVFV